MSYGISKLSLTIIEQLLPIIGASGGISNDENKTSGTYASGLLQYLQGYNTAVFGFDLT